MKKGLKKKTDNGVRVARFSGLVVGEKYLIVGAHDHTDTVTFNFRAEHDFRKWGKQKKLYYTDMEINISK